MSSHHSAKSHTLKQMSWSTATDCKRHNVGCGPKIKLPDVARHKDRDTIIETKKSVFFLGFAENSSKEAFEDSPSSRSSCSHMDGSTCSSCIESFAWLPWPGCDLHSLRCGCKDIQSVPLKQNDTNCPADWYPSKIPKNVLCPGHGLIAKTVPRVRICLANC